MIKGVLDWIKKNPNRFMFLIPIVLVAGISISHVVAWYDISNPINWAIYLSIAIEVGAATALVAATNKIKGGVWFMFGIVTFIQILGNVFFSYKEIDENGELFKDWVELSSPFWEMLGTESTDIIALKRWLAVLSGGLLPIISLTSLHFFVNYETNVMPTNQIIEDTNDDKPIEENKPEIQEDLNIEYISESIEMEQTKDKMIEEQPTEEILTTEPEVKKIEKKPRKKKEPKVEENLITEGITLDENSTTTTTVKLQKLKYTKP